jgi:hypothetical protein
VKEDIHSFEFYECYVLEVDKARMFELEEEVRKIVKFHEDEDVEAQVGSFIPYLGCTRSRNSKFYRTLKLY